MNIANQEQVAPSPRRISEAEMKRYFIPKDEIVVILMTIGGVLFILIGLVLVGLATALIGGGIIVAPLVGSTHLTDTAYDCTLSNNEALPRIW